MKQALFPVFSILLFLAIWQSGAEHLYNKEANRKIEKALKDQGEEAALVMKSCIESGAISCQPNTLPSPVQVWSAYISLLEDHKIISGKKEAFSLKTANTNAKRKAQGLDPIVYTGRPSFVDQIITSLKTVFAGFLLAALIAIPVGIIIGLSQTLRTSLDVYKRQT